jgi:hypothetical protein
MIQAIEQPLASVNSGAPDTPLVAAAWMAQSWGFAMPPIPAAWLDRLHEFRTGEIYATRQDLTERLSRAQFEVELSRGGWPVPGLAFGFTRFGRFGHWFYLLAGGRQVIHVELRVRLDDDRAAESGFALISAANRFIERHLSDEVALARYLNPEPPAPGSAHRIVFYGNQTGIDRETVVTWSQAEGWSEERATRDVFDLNSASRIADRDQVVFRP